VKTILPAFVCLLLLACNNPKPTLPVKTVTVKKSIDTSNVKITTTDTLDFLNGSVLLIGDKRIGKYLDNAQVKFEPYVGFNTFKAREIYKGPKAKINYNSNKIAREYRTMVTQGYASGNEPDFAGYYKIARWSCGMPCQKFVLIDMRDGKVYEGPYTENSFNAIAESRLCIVNPPPDSTGYIELYCVWCKPRMYVWNEEGKYFEELLPGGDLKPVEHFYGP
jgi:hypothetical protein